MSEMLEYICEKRSDSSERLGSGFQLGDTQKKVPGYPKEIDYVIEQFSWVSPKYLLSIPELVARGLVHASGPKCELYTTAPQKNHIYTQIELHTV